MNITCIIYLSRFQQADFAQPWKTKTCHGRRSWRMIHRFKDTSRYQKLRFLFPEDIKGTLHQETLLRVLVNFAQFSIDPSMVQKIDVVSSLQFKARCARDKYETIWRKKKLFSAGWRKGNWDCGVEKKRVGRSHESKSSTLWQDGSHLQVFTLHPTTQQTN